MQYECTTPMVLYFERPSGHVVEKPQWATEDPEMELYFEQ